MKFAVERLGVKVIVSDDPSVILSADKVLLPGVGSASSAMNNINQKLLVDTIQQITNPVLGICLGMQLMCQSSEEGNTTGLGIFNVDVVKFSKKVKVPQIGWNEISNLKTNLFKDVKEGSHIYMVHSFYAPLSNETIATSNYEVDYSAALQKDNFYGTQFHPEKSGVEGSKILQNFLNL